MLRKSSAFFLLPLEKLLRKPFQSSIEFAYTTIMNTCPFQKKTIKKKITVQYVNLEGSVNFWPMSIEQKMKSKYQRDVSYIPQYVQKFACYLLLPIRGLILVWNSHRSVARWREAAHAQPTNQSTAPEEWRSRIGHFRQRYNGSVHFQGRNSTISIQNLPLTRTYELLNPPLDGTHNLNQMVLGRRQEQQFIDCSSKPHHLHPLHHAVTDYIHLHPLLLAVASCPRKS